MKLSKDEKREQASRLKWLKNLIAGCWAKKDPERQDLIFRVMNISYGGFYIWGNRTAIRRQMIELVKVADLRALEPFFSNFFVFKFEPVLESVAKCELLQAYFARAPQFATCLRNSRQECTRFGLEIQTYFEHIANNYKKLMNQKHVMSLFYTIITSLYETHSESEVQRSIRQEVYDEGNNSEETENDHEDEMRNDPQSIFGFGIAFMVRTMFSTIIKSNCNSSVTDPLTCPLLTWLLRAASDLKCTDIIRGIKVATGRVIRTESIFDTLVSDRWSVSVRINPLLERVALPFICQLIKSCRESRGYIIFQLTTRFMNKYDIGTSASLLSIAVDAISSSDELHELAGLLCSVEVQNTCFRLNKHQPIISIAKAFARHKTDGTQLLYTIQYVLECVNHPEQLHRSIIQWRRPKSMLPKITDCQECNLMVAEALAAVAVFNAHFRGHIHDLDESETCILLQHKAGASFLISIISADLTIGNGDLSRAIMEKTLKNCKTVLMNDSGIWFVMELFKTNNSDIQMALYNYLMDPPVKRVFGRGRKMMALYSLLKTAKTKEIVGANLPTAPLATPLKRSRTVVRIADDAIRDGNGTNPLLRRFQSMGPSNAPKRSMRKCRKDSSDEWVPGQLQ